MFWAVVARGGRRVGILRYASSHKTSRWTADLQTGIVSSSSSSSYNNNQIFQTIIGLEIHAQLDIATKLFSGCPVAGGGGGGGGTTMHSRPNTHVWPLDVAVPGFLPRLSRQAVQAAVLSAAALQCTIPPLSRFERKHYYYADIPLGYQMTQQRWPIAIDGTLSCQRSSRSDHHHPNPQTGSMNQVSKKKNNHTVSSSSSSISSSTDRSRQGHFTVGIERIQLEQDTGKTILRTRLDETESWVDFNRAGSALIEIVLRPDLRSAHDAVLAVETLRNLLRHIGTCDGKMEEGSFRCDLNISIAPYDAQNDTIHTHTNNNNVDVDDDDDEEKWDTNLLSLAGNRVEVKNLNSLRQILLAAQYEAERQAEAVVHGKPTQQETRTFDVRTGTTVLIRSKEGAKDYRFMPEPDLPPLILDSEVGFCCLVQCVFVFVCQCQRVFLLECIHIYIYIYKPFIRQKI